jgi:MarR family transcriptional regulator, negative regulator of the multidrug operon emrRAB
MGSPDLAELRHGANVLRALARNLPPKERPTPPPLDHPSARDAVTLLAWRGEVASETLQFALGLSQPASVRLVDRLVDAGVVARHRRAGDRRVWLRLTAKGRRAAGSLLDREREPVEAALRDALPDRADLSRFVAALDQVAMAVLGDTTDPARFCRACDVAACLGSEHGCPSATVCRRNAGQA